MSWESELKDEIKLTSPNFGIFTALWKGDSRNSEKKLGIFGPPKFQGEIVQDLDTKSTRYSINFFFEGFFNNSEAEDFFEAWSSEPGQWEVIHPVKGPLILQPVSCTEIINPVESGNITEFNTEWIVPANITRLISPDELAASILTSAINAIGDALLVLQQLKADLYSAVQSAINIMNKAAGFMDNILGAIASTDALITELYESSRAALDNALAAYGIGNPETDDMGTAMSNSMSAPVNVSDDFVQRFESYSEVSTEILTLAPTGVTKDDYNAIVSMEFTVTTALIAIAQIVATSTFETRADVVSAMENLTDTFETVTAALEEIQSAFSGLGLDLQYFSQSQNYTSLVNLFTLAMRYLINQFYNLKSEKRFTLKKPRSPLEITVTEYGELGENDLFYDLFLTSNKLSGNDILILPAGREVVIYA